MPNNLDPERHRVSKVLIMVNCIFRQWIGSNTARSPFQSYLRKKMW
jgi:hypothetical protein